MRSGLTLLFGGLVWLVSRRLSKPETADGEGEKRRFRPGGFAAIGAALLVAALVWLPFVWLGALGSLLDTVVQLVSGLACGLAAAWLGAWVLLPGLSAQGEPNRSRRTLDVLIGGLVFGTALNIFASSLAFPYGVVNALLMTYLPALAWVALSQLLLSRSGANGGSPAWLPTAILLGLATSASLVWLDADELGLGIALDAGEILQWAFIATMLAALIGLAASAIAVIYFLARNPGAEPRRWPGPVLVAIAGSAWLITIFIYVSVGQPGFYGERLYVIMKDQADVSAATQIGDYSQRRQFVYDTLVKQADASQADLRRSLDRLGMEYTPFYLVNSLEVNGGPLVRLWLSRQPGVDRVLDSPHMRPLVRPPGALPVGAVPAPSYTEWNLTMIEADQVWKELGVTGKGILIGQQDSGAQGDHPELAEAYRGYQGAGTPAQNDYSWFDPWNHTEFPTDGMGHGTHTLGTILGKTVGIAPDARWIGCTNLARNLGNPPFYLDCMQFLFAPFPQNGDPFKDGKPEMGAMVLNNSWGCPDIEGCDPDALLPAVKALRAAGIFNAVSAGNEGPQCSTIQDPLALYDEVYSVGAIDSSGDLTSFSSVGPVTADGSGRVKPDIVAPGQDVTSAMPGNGYASMSGTSMAGPHLAGVVALMWSANPKLIGDIDRTEQILDETAKPYQGSLPQCPGAEDKPSTAVGFGILDAYAAVQAALQSK